MIMGPTEKETTKMISDFQSNIVHSTVLEEFE